MKYVLIALVAFIGLIFAIAEMKRSADIAVTEEAIEEIDHAQIYAELISSMISRGQDYMLLFNANELDALHEQFSSAMKQLMPLEDLVEFHERTLTQLGEEARITSEKLNPIGDNFVYDRISIFQGYEGEVQIQITLNANQEIVGFQIQPYSSEE